MTNYLSERSEERAIHQLTGVNPNLLYMAGAYSGALKVFVETIRVEFLGDLPADICFK